LVSAFVNGHPFRRRLFLGGVHVPSTGEERRILHASGPTAVGRVHDGDRIVRIFAVPFAVVAKRLEGRIEIAVDHVRVVGLRQKDDGDLLQRVMSIGSLARIHFIVNEFANRRHEIRRGHPGKVVDVLLVEIVGGGVVRIVLDVLRNSAAGTDDVVGRDRNLHIVDAVVGKILRIHVELVAIPRTLPPDADLWKPLADEVVIADGTRPSDWQRLLCLKFYSEFYRLTVRNRPRGADLENGLVVHISVVRLDVLERVRDIHLAPGLEHLDTLHVGVSIVFLPHPRPEAPPGLLDKRAAVIFPGVVIEVEGEFLLGVAGSVSPLEDFPPADDVGRGVELDVHGVMDNAVALCREFQILIPWFRPLHKLWDGPRKGLLDEI
jgi:hypothetical protein